MTHALTDLGPRVDMSPAGKSSAAATSASGAAFAEAVDAAVDRAQQRSARPGTREESARGAHEDHDTADPEDRAPLEASTHEERAADRPDGHDSGKDERDPAAAHRHTGLKADVLPLVWTVVPHLPIAAPAIDTAGAADRIGHHGTAAVAVDSERHPTRASRTAPFHFAHDPRLGHPALPAGLDAATTATVKAATTGMRATLTTGPMPGADTPANALATDRSGRSAASAALAAPKGVVALKAPPATPAATPPGSATATALNKAGDHQTKVQVQQPVPSERPAYPPAPARPAAFTTPVKPMPIAEHHDRSASTKSPSGSTAHLTDTGSGTTANPAALSTSPAQQSMSAAPVHAPTITSSIVNSAPAAAAPPAPAVPVPMAQPHVATILAQLRGVADGTYQLRARVHPAELGAVSITATVHSGSVHIVLSPDQTAQQAVSQALPQLRAHLADQGFTGVDVGLGSPHQSPGHQDGNGGGGRGTHTQGSDHSAGVSRTDAIEGLDGAARSTRRAADPASALDEML